MTTSAEIRARLVEKFPFKEGWITMAEVTPPKTQRRFDLIAIQGWQSRGHEAAGFEIKVSRSDWLRELSEPSKADPLVRLCSRWWIAAPPGVVEVAELPATWGLLVIHPEQIRTGKQAPQLNPDPWSDAVWRCMLLRLATREARTPDELGAARAEGSRIGYEQAEKNHQASLDHAEKRERELLERIDQAEKATGVQLRHWCDYPALGEAMKMIRSSGNRTIADRLERQSRELRHAALTMRRAAQSIKGVEALAINEGPL